MKSMLAILAFVSFHAQAEYRFNGHHSIKLFADHKSEVYASVCYNNYRHCPGSIRIGSTQDLSAFIQRQIFHRADVTLSNYDLIYSQSREILSSHQRELEKRKHEQAKFSGGDPVKARALKAYVDEAQARVLADARAISNLEEGRESARLFDQEFQDTIAGDGVRTFDRNYGYGIEYFLFNSCRANERGSECWHAGLQFFLKERGTDLEGQLIAQAIRQENARAGYPKKILGGLRLALLTTDVSRFGTRHISQSTDPVKMEVKDNYHAECSARSQTGTLKMTQMGCNALGKNWRFPTLKELRSLAPEFRSHLPRLDPTKLFQTLDVRGFVNPGAAHLILCKPVYFNLVAQKAINNQTGIVRSFIFGKDPGDGVGGLCVCERNCTN